MTYPTKKIGEVCDINPVKSEIKDISNDSLVSFVPMSAVSEITQKIENQEDRRLGEAKKGYTYFRKGDILFAKITPCMDREWGQGQYSPYICVVIVSKNIKPRFLWFYCPCSD